MALIKRCKWVLIVSGCILCATLVVTAIYSSSLESRAIRRALSDNDYPEALRLYSSLMAKEPSGTTAGKMVDVAIASKNSSRLYKALRDDIFPHLEISGVREAFTRGGIVWLEGAKFLNTEARWLAEQLTLNGTDVTHRVRTLYQNIVNLEDILMWGSWVSDLVGMDTDCQKFLANGVMEYLSQQPWPAPTQGSFQEFLIQAHALLPEGTEAEMLDLWLNRSTLSALEPNERLAAITPPTEQTNADVYWLLRALALTNSLDDGWEHPLGLDVAAEFQDIYPNLSSPYRQSMFTIMYDTAKTGPLDNLTLLMEVAAKNPEDIILDSAQEAVELLHILADSKAVSDFVDEYAQGSPKPVTAIASELWSKRIVTKLAVLFQPRWEDNLELLAWSDIARIIGKPIASTMEVVRSKDYEEITFPLYTSWSHPVLVFRDSRGVIMFDLERWQERVVPGNTFALSPDGSRLVTLEWKPDSSVFRIYDMEGNQLDNFSLEIDLRPRELENHWRTKLSWPEQDLLYTYYFGGEGYEPPFEDFHCSINISSREYTHSTDWSQSLIPLEPGVFRDHNWNLFDDDNKVIGSGGTRIDNGQNSHYASYQLGNSTQVTFRSGQILLISAGKEKDITPAETTVTSLQGVAATEDAIYMELSCPPYWSEYPDIYRYSLISGEIEQLMQPAWQQSFADNRETGRSWLLTPDDKPVPLLFASDYSIEVFYTGSSYYLVAYHWRAHMYGHFELKYPLMLYTVRERDR